MNESGNIHHDPAPPPEKPRREYRHLPPIPPEAAGLEPSSAAEHIERELGDESGVPYEGDVTTSIGRDQQLWHDADNDVRLYDRLVAVKKAKELLERDPNDPKLKANLVTMEQILEDYRNEHGGSQQ